MKAMNRPIPIAIAFFSSSGIARMIVSRKPLSTSTVTTAPSSTISPIADGKERCSVPTRVKATIALIPSPGASA
jgi:hypothetical protein